MGKNPEKSQKDTGKNNGKFYMKMSREPLRNIWEKAWKKNDENFFNK